MQRLWCLPCLLLLLACCSFPVQAAKTDVVYLNNGDRITGEIKTLSRGKLEFSTDHMGTVFIEWTDIKDIVSDKGQAVELTNGQRFYGPLGKTEDENTLVVQTGEGQVGVSHEDVFGMYAVEAGFWDRLDLSASVGVGWDKGSDVGKYNMSLDGVFRDPRFITRASFDTVITTQEGRDDTTRSLLNLSHLAYREQKFYRQVFGNLESNDELGIDLRALLGAGIGWMPIRSQTSLFTLGFGLAANHELPTQGEAETNVELVGSLNYEYFRYSDPERDFSTNLTVYPNLTDRGRWRATFDTALRWELYSDLFWKMSFYATYDNQPLSEGASSSDYGVNSSLGYKF